MNETVVTRAVLYEVAIPLREPFAISGGTMAVRRSLIVRLFDQAGNDGWGEAAPFEQPFYSAETTASASALLRTVLLPRLVGRPLNHPAEVLAVLSEGVRGNRMAIAGAETAWWDLQAACSGTNLADLVTGRLAQLGAHGDWLERRPYLECGVALGVPDRYDRAILERWVREAVSAGYRRVKLKVRPGWDVEAVTIAQRAMTASGRTVPLWVDANGAYDLARDADALSQLDRLGLLFLEQPLAEDALWDSRALSRTLKTPVCLDESLVSDEVARQVVEMGGPLIWNIKVQRVGGLEEACRIYARAGAAGARVWGGTMPETGLGAQTMLALGGHGGFTFPTDIEPSDRWYAPQSDLIELKMDSDGTMPVPTQRPVPDFESRLALIADIK